jgi:hypothetical protein
VAFQPSAMSTRMSQYEEMYQFYAYRNLTVWFVPEQGTAAVGSLALGLMQDWNEDTSNFATPTKQQVMEFKPSLFTQIGLPCKLQYLHRGSKLWTTSVSNSQPGDLSQQIAAVAVLAGATASTTYGSLYVEGVIDFYRQSPVQSNPSLRLRNVIRTAKRLGIPVNANDLRDVIRSELGEDSDDDSVVTVRKGKIPK